MIRDSIRVFLKFIALIMLVGITVFFILLGLFFRNQNVAKKNELNIAKIQMKMPAHTVLKIMGKSYSKFVYMNDSVYVYQSSFFSSGNFEIVFDSEMEVKNVLVPEGYKPPFIHH